MIYHYYFNNEPSYLEIRVKQRLQYFLKQINKECFSFLDHLIVTHKSMKCYQFNFFSLSIKRKTFAGQQTIFMIRYRNFENK